jgi:hypothetical protein
MIFVKNMDFKESEKMDYFYCYDKSLMKHLRYDHNINFICCGLHPKTKIMFWQFMRTNELSIAMTEYFNVSQTCRVGEHE